MGGTTFREGRPPFAARLSPARSRVVMPTATFGANRASLSSPVRSRSSTLASFGRARQRLGTGMRAQGLRPDQIWVPDVAVGVYAGKPRPALVVQDDRSDATCFCARW